MDGRKLHVDSSLIEASASKDSVVRSSPEMIAALKQAYQAQESKLEDATTPGSYESVNDRLISTTDPDAAVARKGGEPARPRYHHHRAVDDACGVITAVETTPGSIAENKKLLPLIEQHEANTQTKVEVAVADHKYGTSENYIACQQQEIRTHMGDVLGKQKSEANGIFPDTAFKYQPEKDSYLCPGGKELVPRRPYPARRTIEYHVPRRGCLSCSLREQCTRSKTGRTVQRHHHQELLDKAREQAHSIQAKRDRKRRQVLIEGSFADAANNHGFKRSRWRRLWRQQIQDWMIAAIQNIRTLLKASQKRASGAVALMAGGFNSKTRSWEPDLSAWLLIDNKGVGSMGRMDLRFVLQMNVRPHGNLKY